MPHTLYKFGLDPDEPTTKTSTPTPILTAAQISILWVSWCDLIYTTLSSTNARCVIYSGTSLSTSQKEQITTAPGSHITQALANPRCRLTFFGSTMHDGVRGYMTRTDYPDSTRGDDCDNVVCIFYTDTEQDAYVFHYEWEAWTIPPPFDWSIAEVRICSDNSLILSLKVGINEDDRQDPDEGTGSIIGCKDMDQLRQYCKGQMDSGSKTLASFPPTQLVVNATTATALDEDGHVHTRTADPRYPACLGRPHTGTSAFEPVPYLSETHVTKIASGGYMSGAISEEGELFLWGQASPGTEGELGVLHRLDYQSGLGQDDTMVWADTEQDDYVKCLNIRIDGQDAMAYDVAIGFGHVLVAAKNDGGKHAVFAAGRNSESQLGLGRAVDFVDEFEEVPALRDKKVMQLVGAGWSSYVVTEE